MCPEQLARLYTAADLLVTCTTHHDENFGYAQVEAMACGTPVVGSRWGGLKDTIIDGVTGFGFNALFTANGIRVDWRKGAYLVLELLQDHKLLGELSQTAKQWFHLNCTLSCYAEHLHRLVCDMVNSKKMRVSLNAR